MAGLNPSNAVRDYKPIGNGHIKVAGAKPLVSDVESARMKSKYGKKNPARAGNSECLWPVLPGEIIGLARIVQLVEPHVEVIEQRRTDGFVPSKTEIVGEARLEEVRVEWRRQRLGSVKLFLVAAAIGEEEFIAVSPVLINPERHGGIENGVSGVEDKIVPQRVSNTWISVNRQEGENLLRDRANTCDLVAGKGDAAPDETSGARSGC